MKDKKKNVVILVDDIYMGGISTALVNILTHLDINKYNVLFLVEEDECDDNLVLQQLPKHIKPKFLRSASLLQKAVYYRNMKRNIFQKIYYNYFLWKFRVTPQNLFKKYTYEEFGHEGIDVFIDFGYSVKHYINKLKAKKRIVWRHALFSEEILPDEKDKYLQYWSKFDKIVTVSKGNIDILKKEYPTLASKAQAAYNPINLDKILTLSNEFKELVGNEEELLQENYIVTVTRLNFVAKDYNTLINAYKIAKKQGFEWKLYIVGDGPDRESVIDFIETNGLSNDIVLFGMKNNPYVIMKNAKFSVLSSRHEGFGLVLVESMAVGVPVVSSDCPGGPREILQEGKSGILVPVGDAQAMADKFMELYNDKALLEKYSLAGKIRAKDFGVEATMKVIEQIIDE